VEPSDPATIFEVEAVIFLVGLSWAWIAAGVFVVLVGLTRRLWGRR
jgi:hypothetical protein